MDLSKAGAALTLPSRFDAEWHRLAIWEIWLECRYDIVATVAAS